MEFKDSPIYKGLSDAERTKYDALTDAKEKEQFELLAAVKHEVTNLPALKALTALENTPAEIKALKEQLATLKPGEDLTPLKTALEKLGLDVKALKENPRAEVTMSIAKQLEQHKEQIKKFKAGEVKSLTIEIKATQTSTDIDGRANYFMWHENGQIGTLPVRAPFMRELFTNKNSTSEYIKYTDQETAVRDAKNVALCGATTHNTKLTWKVYDLKVDKVRDFITICIDMLDDYSFVEGEIRRLLDESLALKIDEDLLTGDGSSPNLIGIQSIASTFSASNADPEADYTASVQSPNLIDLISIAGAQIRTFGKNNKWQPNAVLLSPRDLQLMKMLKDAERNYLKTPMLRPSLFQDANGRYYIDGMTLIENSLVPPNEFYIGDFRRGTVYARPGVTIEFSYENRENFEQELVTVKAYERLNLLVRNVDQNAFMRVTDIAAALAAIDEAAGS